MIEATRRYVGRYVVEWTADGSMIGYCEGGGLVSVKKEFTVRCDGPGCDHLISYRENAPDERSIVRRWLVLKLGDDTWHFHHGECLAKWLEARRRMTQGIAGSWGYVPPPPEA